MPLLKLLVAAAIAVLATPHVTPAPAPLVDSFKREEAIDVTPKAPPALKG